MDAILIVVISAMSIVVVIYFVSRKRSALNDAGHGMMMLQNQLSELTRAVDQKLGSVDQKVLESARAMQQQMQQQFGESTRIIREITQELVRVGEGQKQVMTVTEQLQNLQDILKNPKQRGVLGEYFLETVLKNVLPPSSYQMQYSFSNKVIVDAVVFVDKRIIPIDSKFSLENYNRILEARDATEKKRYEAAFINDLKTRIDETSKYVKPEEGTMDFAFMFIPSEAVYYDLLINKVGAVTDDTKNLIHYAGQKKVIIVSPTSFLAYLQTVLQGLKNQKISEQAKEIIKQVENLGRHLGTYEDYMQKLGKNLGAAVGMYNNAYKEFGKIDKDVVRITGGTAGFAEPVALEKPEEVV